MTIIQEKVAIGRDAATGTVTCEAYRRDGKLHRDDGPALIARDPATGVVTYEIYWRDGKLHKDDGPAVVKRDPATGTVTREAYWREDVEIPAPPKAAAFVAALKPAP